METKSHDSKPYRILFICLGNICRSPAAEGIMKALVERNGLTQKFLIDSAGTGGWHVGQLPDPRMRKLGTRHGYTFNSRARQFSHEDFSHFDLIVVMDGENYSSVISRAHTEQERAKVVCMADYLTYHPHQATIPDPYYGGEPDFEQVIELLEEACQELLARLTHNEDWKAV